MRSFVHGRWCTVVLALSACQAPSNSSPPAATVAAVGTATLTVAPPTAVPPTSPLSVPRPSQAPPPLDPDFFDRDLVIRCWLDAMNALAWLGAGAHDGSFMQTALKTGRMPAECEPLASEKHSSGFPVQGGGTLHWRRDGERLQGERAVVTITFYCLGDACARSDEIEIELPATWYCTSWLHGRDHGSACFRTASACEQGRASIAPGRDTMPCARREGAAYCAPSGHCYPNPWGCARESGGSIEEGTCVRTDR
jgi:hypothetical protein